MVAMTTQYIFCVVPIFKNYVNAYSFIYFSDIFSFNRYNFQGSNHPCFFENGPFGENKKTLKKKRKYYRATSRRKKNRLLMIALNNVNYKDTI